MQAYNRFSDQVAAVIDHSGHSVRVVDLDAASLDVFGYLDVILRYNFAEQPGRGEGRRAYYRFLVLLKDGRYAFIDGGMELEQMDDDRLPEWWPFGCSVVALNSDLLLAEREKRWAVTPQQVEEIQKWIRAAEEVKKNGLPPAGGS